MNIIYIDEFFYCFDHDYELIKDMVKQSIKQHIKHKDYHKLNMKELESTILKPDPHPYGWYRKFEKKRFQ